MATRARLDTELVRRGLARTREQARQLVADGHVAVSGRAGVKAATAVGRDEQVTVVTPPAEPTYVSRGAHKLRHALDVFPVEPAGRRALDAGASTGGFTDVLLRAGVAEVVAVDVGYGQLAWPLRQDPRVTVVERTNVRYLDALPGGPADLVVADLSFIPLAVVLPALARLSSSDAEAVVLVKPQFEVGRDRLPRGGVVRDPADRLASILGASTAAAAVGFATAGVTYSPLPGPAGNVEYLLWLRKQPLAAAVDVSRLATRAVAEGPQ